jgi:intraflagellar transport protein 140
LQYYYKKAEFKADISEKFVGVVVKEYASIDSNDEALIRTVTDFSFKLAIGMIDDAAKVIKLIKNEAVWENMARVCIKMRRTKLAKLCLGKLKNAKALRTISSLPKLKDDGSMAAQYALHLGLYDDAKDIWSETSNYPQLTSFAESGGDWETAIETSVTKDRPALPTVYFQFGRYLEEMGDTSGAIAAYEKSQASK